MGIWVSESGLFALLMDGAFVIGLVLIFCFAGEAVNIARPCT